MAEQQGMKKKPVLDEITQIINKILVDAAKTRGGLTPKLVQEFYEEGQKAQNERGFREAKPSKQISSIVAHKNEERVTTKVRANNVDQKALVSAVDLAERLQLAAQGRKLSIREWMEG
jgi:hypothetical protein